jgi:anti-sigma factor RsiW
MKTCSRNAQAITELALGTLTGDAANQLRAHLEHCGGCREYFDQMRSVTGALANAPVRTDIETSEIFHRKLLSRLESGRQSSPWHWVRASLLQWRIAGPSVAAVAAICVMVVFWPRHPNVQEFVQMPTSAHLEPRQDLNPSLANYQKVANRSLDSLDDLIAQQSKKRSAPVPVYRASMLLAEATD